MGKLKGKVTKPGDNGMLKYKTDSGERIEVAYDQPFSKELGIGDNTSVTFELVSKGGTPIAVSVNPIDKGTIIDISYEKGGGTIEETESGIQYPFRQNYLRESKFELGQTVKYSLAPANGSMIATSLIAVQ